MTDVQLTLFDPSLYDEFRGQELHRKAVPDLYRENTFESNLRVDIQHIQDHLMKAKHKNDALYAHTLGAPMSDASLQKTIETTESEFEDAALIMRRLYDQTTDPEGAFSGRSLSKWENPVGRVEIIQRDWLRITLNTLLPHCRYRSATWLKDTICRLLYEYRKENGKLPYYDRVMLFIEECCDIKDRHIFDQDNRGWKAVSNAVKGLLFIDDGPFTLSFTLSGKFSHENIVRMTFIPLGDVVDYIQYCEENQQISQQEISVQ